MKRHLFLIISLLIAGVVAGQDLRHYEYLYGRNHVSSPNNDDTLNHSSIRNFYFFTQPVDPFSAPFSPKKWYSGLVKKVFHENLVIIKRPGYLITADPLFDVELGRETVLGSNSWSNTRGGQVYGKIEMGKDAGEDSDNILKSHKKFTPTFEFYSSYYESQARFPGYMDSISYLSGGVPGQGFIQRADKTWDYGYSTGWVRFAANKHFTFELGTGKNFFGNGYRSMLLSDNSRNYPYFRIDTRIWRIHYTNLWAEFQDTRYHDGPLGAYQKKYGAFHYLSYSLTNRLEISLFEAIIWQGRDSLHTRGFDISYLNPVIFMRPVEWTLGSPDNALMGINLSYRLSGETYLYSQFLIDEFDVSHMKARDGYWANKFAGQFGAKTFIPLKPGSRSLLPDTRHPTPDTQYLIPDTRHPTPEPGIFLQSELNFARPYTYAHWTSKQNYGHMGQPLAHPLGANFVEWVSFARVNWNRFVLEGRYSRARFGSNLNGLNYGQDIFLSYDTFVNELGNYIGQGLPNKLTYISLTGSFLLNPSSLLNVFFTVTDRHQVTDVLDNHNLWLMFGVRSSIRNLYFDY